MRAYNQYILDFFSLQDCPYKPRSFMSRRQSLEKLFHARTLYDIMNRWQRPELYRHPAVPALAILAHMADGGKGQVHAGHQEFAVRRVTLNQTTALLAPKEPTEHCQYLKDRMEMTI